MRQRGSGPEINPAVDQDQAIVAEAKKSCTPADCEAAHQAINQLPPGSQWRSSADFAQIEATWAESILARAKAEPDPAARRALLQRLATSPTADPSHRGQASDLLALIVDAPAPSPTDLPQAGKDAGTITQNSVTPPSSVPPTPTQRPTPTSHTTVTNATTPPAPTPPPATTPKPTAGGTPLERAQKAALEGQPAAVRAILEGRVMGGHASPEEARLLRAACKQMGDTACADAVRAKYPQ